MGKKSRLKKEKQKNHIAIGEEIKEQRDGFESFLLHLIEVVAGVALFCPLVFATHFYFPYVGPKSLFFMAMCQVIFFTWLILAIRYKKYRPKLNFVLIAMGFFLFILILSALFGVDPSRSFWSKFERMTGVLMWLHLFGFFLALSSTFKKISQWKNLLIVSLSVAIILSTTFLIVETESRWFAPETGSIFTFARGGGATLGNSSFLGSYLLFNVFIGLYLFFRDDRKWAKILAVAAIILGFLAIFASGARAATLATLGGMGLVFLLFLSFYQKNKRLRKIGIIFLIISILIVLSAFVMLFFPQTFVHKKFIELTTQARYLNWQIAWKGFLDRPLLGWGPENYTVLFPKYFHPCLFTKECGSEIWFDRTHNIILDTLSMTGILGLLSYLSLFVISFFVLCKKFFKEKLIDFFGFSIFTSLLIAYFIQNLTVFDMVASLMMFVLCLSFLSFLTKKEERKEQLIVSQKKWPIIAVLIIFSITFFQFIIQPLKTDSLTIDAIAESPNPDIIDQLKERGDDQVQAFLRSVAEKRIALYNKTLETSPMGKYQIRDFFAQHTQEILNSYISLMPVDVYKKELDAGIALLEDSVKDSPLDYRSALKLAQLYNLYIYIEPEKLERAEELARKALDLSPTNQQSYWALTQTNLYMNNLDVALDYAEKAIILEPNWFQSYLIAHQIAGFKEDATKQEEIIERAKQINPDWENNF